MRFVSAYFSFVCQCRQAVRSNYEFTSVCIYSIQSIPLSILDSSKYGLVCVLFYVSLGAWRQTYARVSTCDSEKLCSQLYLNEKRIMSVKRALTHGAARRVDNKWTARAILKQYVYVLRFICVCVTECLYVCVRVCLLAICCNMASMRKAHLCFICIY